MSIEEQGVPPDTWQAVEAQMRRIVAQSSETFAESTVRNAEKLIAACERRIRMPDQVEKGYWSTVCLFWDGIEVEVCDDRYEFYDLRDGGMHIEHFEMSSGEDVPEKLFERLQCLKIET
jgi:hypothetical protein